MSSKIEDLTTTLASLAKLTKQRFPSQEEHNEVQSYLVKCVKKLNNDSEGVKKVLTVFFKQQLEQLGSDSDRCAAAELIDQLKYIPLPEEPLTLTASNLPFPLKTTQLPVKNLEELKCLIAELSLDDDTVPALVKWLTPKIARDGLQVKEATTNVLAKVLSPEIPFYITQSGTHEKRVTKLRAIAKEIRRDKYGCEVIVVLVPDGVEGEQKEELHTIRSALDQIPNHELLLDVFQTVVERVANQCRVMGKKSPVFKTFKNEITQFLQKGNKGNKKGGDTMQLEMEGGQQSASTSGFDLLDNSSSSNANISSASEQELLNNCLSALDKSHPDQAPIMTQLADLIQSKFKTSTSVVIPVGLGLDGFGIGGSIIK